jgi:hypothetical protein
MSDELRKGFHLIAHPRFDMLLASASHQRLEEFHRYFSGDEGLRLPPVYFYKGRIARWLTHTFHISAITFGRRIFVKPELIERDAEGNSIVPAWLAAHETAHVLQYEEKGFVRFLISYLDDYFRSLGWQTMWDTTARFAAYSAIKVERAAREAEEAYAAWAEKQRRRNDERGTPQR